MNDHEPDKECLTYPERRNCPTPIFSMYTLFGGRRKTIREKDRKKHIFVDLYSTRLLMAIIFLLCLSYLDAFFTLSLIERGIVKEINPIMAHLLGYGDMLFVLVKFIITALLITLLTICKNVKITRFSLPFAINTYIVVILYELCLFLLTSTVNH